MNTPQAYLEWGEMVHWILCAFGCIVIIAALSKRQLLSSRSQALVLTLLLGIVMVILIGCFPIPFGAEADRDMYANRFLYAEGKESFTPPKKDAGFAYVTFWLSRICDVSAYFIIIACMYISIYILTCRRLAPRGSFWLFAAVTISLSFVSYGMNTMRAGLALSLVLLALTYRSKKTVMGGLMLLATMLHFSTIIPVMMIAVTYFYRKTNIYVTIWLIAVILSFALGNYFNTLFEGLSDDTRTRYLTQANKHYRIGFRIDFIIYSIVPMIVGLYYIHKKKFTDALYTHLLNSYIATNAFWVLVIRANFSDRFAYLSWCMIPFVLVYPLLQQRQIVKNPNKWLATIYAGDLAFLLIL